MFANLLVPHPANGGPPAEWAGLIPIADWNAANSVLDGDGTSVLSVTDASGHGNPLTGLGDTKPQLISSDPAFNGRPTWSFVDDGAAGARFAFASMGIADNSDIFVAVVGISDLTTSNRYVFAFTSIDVAIYGEMPTARWVGWVDAGNGTVRLNSNDDPKIASVVAVMAEADTQTLYVNTPTAEASAPSAGPTVYGAGYVGNYAAPAATFRFGGRIQRVLVFPTALDLARRTTCFNALKAQNGLA